MMISVRTRYSGPTDTRGSRITVAGPYGQRSYSYNYAAYDPHDDAVSEYVADRVGAKVTPAELRDLPHPYRQLSRSGRGYRYTLDTNPA
jgi:hypothetical protein